MLLSTVTWLATFREFIILCANTTVPNIASPLLPLSPVASQKGSFENSAYAKEWFARVGYMRSKANLLVLLDIRKLDLLDKLIFTTVDCS